MEQQSDIKLIGEKLFVGGDLSGIQKFIYNISSKKAAVSLKGRSFYLSEYTEHLCEGIGKLPEAKNYDRVYCSGGKFYIIVDNTPEMRAAIDSYIKDATQKLWDEHKGQLGLNISYVAFSFNSDGTVSVGGGQQEKIGALWKYLTEEFNRLKTKKFYDVIFDNYDSFFEVTPVSEETKVCAITGIESSDCIPLGKEKDERDIYVLPSVKQQVELGKSLRNTESFKTFEEYAKDSYLGVLRMDVDGLGKRFIEGFENIEEYRTFSKRLQYFFTNILRSIQKKEEFCDDLNIVYAGGDDIFAVGKWNKVIEFAYKIQVEFTRYIEDSNITISGGIAIVNEKFPIAKAAELAGEAEDAAKSFEMKIDGVMKKKNAFCMFGEAVSWEKEFDHVYSYKRQLYDMISVYGMSRGVLHKIMLYSTMVKGNIKRREEKKNEDYSYIWHSSYYFTRMLERYKNDEHIAPFIKDVRDKQFTAGERRITLLALAARWAELELKETKNKSK